jgi:D-3-phosphoglycerate dehydrogenase
VEAGTIAGAAIDVFTVEPAVGNILTTSEHIVVTPHLAASTAEAQTRAAIDTAEEILAVLDGRPARFAVNVPSVDPETMAVIGPYLDAAQLAASLARQLAAGRLERVVITYRGEIANHETTPLRAAVTTGLLRGVTEEKLSIVNAARIAEQHGIRIDEDRALARPPYSNLVSVTVYSADGGPHEVTVAATHTSLGASAVSVAGFEGIELAAGSAPYALAVVNVDRPGMVGRVGTLLGQWDVNVNYMSVSASNVEDRALMVLGISRPLTEVEAQAVAALPNVFSARLLDLGLD